MSKKRLYLPKTVEKKFFCSSVSSCSIQFVLGLTNYLYGTLFKIENQFQRVTTFNLPWTFSMKVHSKILFKNFANFTLLEIFDEKEFLKSLFSVLDSDLRFLHMDIGFVSNPGEMQIKQPFHMLN